MQSSSLDDLDLDTFYSPTDPSIRHRGSWITWVEKGTKGAATYFDVPPGCRLGRHTHSAEETVVILEGDAEASVGSDSALVAAPHLIVIPAGQEHDLANAGTATLRAVGFFPTPSVKTTFETELEPAGSKELGSPDRT